MKRITDFLNECNRCELQPPTYYNGFSSAEAYCKHIGYLYDVAVSAFMEIGVDSDLLIKTRYSDVKESMQYHVYPSDLAISRLKLDYDNLRTEGLRKEYAFCEMVKNCHDMQMYYFEKFADYLGNDNNRITVDSSEESTVKNMSSMVYFNDDRNTIRGVRGLAEYLQCGTNKAQAIIKNGVLRSSGVQFKIGKTHCFNKMKLAEVLSSNPDIFKDVHWH